MKYIQIGADAIIPANVPIFITHEVLKNFEDGSRHDKILGTKIHFLHIGAFKVRFDDADGLKEEIQSISRFLQRSEHPSQIYPLCNGEDLRYDIIS